MQQKWIHTNETNTIKPHLWLKPYKPTFPDNIKYLCNILSHRILTCHCHIFYKISYNGDLLPSSLYPPIWIMYFIQNIQKLQKTEQRFFHDKRSFILLPVDLYCFVNQVCLALMTNIIALRDLWNLFKIAHWL